MKHEGTKLFPCRYAFAVDKKHTKLENFYVTNIAISEEKKRSVLVYLLDTIGVIDYVLFYNVLLLLFSKTSHSRIHHIKDNLNILSFYIMGISNYKQTK